MNNRSSFFFRHEAKFGYLILGICLISLAALRNTFVHTNSATFDELLHLQAGYRYWQCGEFANNPEHPPLVKLLPLPRFVIGSSMVTQALVGRKLSRAVGMDCRLRSRYTGHHTAESCSRVRGPA